MNYLFLPTGLASQVLLDINRDIQFVLTFRSMNDPANVVVVQINIPTAIMYFLAYRSPKYPKRGANVM